MTEAKLRQFVVDIMAAWVGSVRSDARHKEILATYNAYKPLPRNHKMLESEHYCAATVSAAWIKAGVDTVAVVECSCTRMMELAQKKGIWVEDDAYVPKPGDAVIYDWQDDGKGDNRGTPDHIGIVERVTGNSMTIIEGNRPLGHVARHQLAVNGRYIRGFITPDYAKLAEPEPVKAATAWVQLPVLRKGVNGGHVRTLQILLNKYNKASLAEDGNYGAKTLAAVKAYQQSRKLAADGVVSALTWGQLLK
jgi:hypothetical protein